METTERRARVAAYKKRSAAAGIYAVRCAPTAQAWIGRAPDLATIQNRVWFALRTGSATRRSLQAAWNAHGADAFGFEVLERIEDEDLAFAREKRLKDRLAHWCAHLGAEPI